MPDIGSILRDIFNFSLGGMKPRIMEGEPTTKDLIEYHNYRNEQVALNATRGKGTIIPLMELEEWIGSGYPKAR